MMSIDSYLNSFQKISLDEAMSVSLMSRVDKKFVFSIKQISKLLIDLMDFYNILEINKSKIQKYNSLYYDTVDRFFFFQHHNNRVNRHKVRFREYVGSGLSFLEVKCKNNKKKTIKNRIQVDTISSDGLSEEQKQYIDTILGKKLILVPQQYVSFDRVTLINKLKTERLTIDLNLEFSNNIKSGRMTDIVIAEIKKDRSSYSSQFTKVAKSHAIYPFRISKYCMSTIKLNPGIKHNRFKEKLLLINKIKELT